jgi:hypothetical protein
MALTIETKVSESVAAIRRKAKEEAENASMLKIAEREEQIAGMARSDRGTKAASRARLATASRRGVGAAIREPSPAKVSA